MLKIIFLTLFCMVFSMTFFQSRCGEKPGEGALAKKGYENAKPIIAALEKYRQDKGNYPPNLSALMPNYLDKIPLDENDKSYEYQYKEENKTYVLSFDYDAPGLGICECSYYPEKKDWFCSCKV